MLLEKRIDDLIEAGWEVLTSDFDEKAFLNWRKRAVDCLTDLVGSEHMLHCLFQRLRDRCGGPKGARGLGAAHCGQRSGIRKA